MKIVGQQDKSNDKFSMIPIEVCFQFEKGFVYVREVDVVCMDNLDRMWLVGTKTFNSYLTFPSS